jgi:predicted DNA-binding mobile mystery protein A
MSEGWIFTVRKALNMTLRQLAAKMGATAQNVKKLEQREKEGSISLRKLRETADALDMKFVYAFLPKDGSLEKLIEKKASQKAKEIVGRTSHTMSLEDQKNSDERLRKAIEQKTETIARELPRYLWD